MAKQSVAPIRSGERLKSLDALRGFALLGILVPNIIAFGWSQAAMVNVSVMGDSPANQLGYDITSVAFLGKFMFNFAMLFGAGVIVYAHKYDNGDTPTKLSTGAGLWHRRCAILLAFGLVHAYFFWYGDILTWYAVAGLTLLWWVRRVPLSVQGLLSLLCYGLGTLLMVGVTLFGIWAIKEGHITASEMEGGDPVLEAEGYLGTWLSAFLIRLPSVLGMHILLLPLFVPALWGIMLLGMVLTRNGVLTGERTMQFYIITGLVGILVGGAASYLIFANLSSPDREFGELIWRAVAQPVGIPLALGYAMLVIAATKTSKLNIITTPLAAVGRMALTNYFLHTILCTSLFYGYGWGLGYFGKIQYPQLWYVVGSVWVVNIVFSLLWLKFFRFGPVEWAWRCMTYGKLLPILHTRSTPTQN
jgi:uncharacterized protein